MAMLFVPFRREVLQYSSWEKLHSPCLCWWCSSPFIPSEIYSWYLHPSEIGISDNIPLRETSLLVLTPSENLIYLGGVDIKWNGPVLAPKGKSKTPYPSLISDTVPFWWRGCSFMLSWAMCLKMSLEVSVECYFICITKHSPPNILLANELLVIEYCFYHLFVAVYSLFLLHHCPPSPWCGPSSWSVQCLCVWPLPDYKVAVSKTLWSQHSWWTSVTKGTESCCTKTISELSTGQQRWQLSFIWYSTK